MPGMKNEVKSRSHYMQFVSAQQDNLCMLIKQMGADVKPVNGLTCIATFHVGGAELMYVYNLNAEEEYFLHRIQPYPMSADVFLNTAEIAEYIERDVSAFRNAAQSGQFEPFVELNRRLTELSKGLEETFMQFNVPGEYFEQAGKDLESLERLLSEIRQNARPLQPEP